MLTAIRSGDDATLATRLRIEELFWLTHEPWTTPAGKASKRRINVGQASEQLATSEFNTW